MYVRVVRVVTLVRWRPGSPARLDGELARPCGDGEVAASVSVVDDAHRGSLPVSAEHIAEGASSTAVLRVPLIAASASADDGAGLSCPPPEQPTVDNATPMQTMTRRACIAAMLGGDRYSASPECGCPLVGQRPGRTPEEIGASRSR